MLHVSATSETLIPELPFVVSTVNNTSVLLSQPNPIEVRALISSYQELLLE
jgi:hypothetical protein